jgi:glyoxylase-like metal-dependent hydrolase (beta-lactamase superfamily II)
LTAIGVKVEDVNTVLITHMHSDHISGLLKGKDATFPNARVLLSENEKAFWVKGGKTEAD